MSLSKREQIYTRFGTYISRIRSVGYDKMLLGAADEDEFRKMLSQIFYEKWKNNIGYPEIPDYFFRYLDFLRMQTAIHDDIKVEGLASDVEEDESGDKIGRYEERFVTNRGKLRILANPNLIRIVKAVPEEDIAAVCREFYSPAFSAMKDKDWKSLAEEARGVKKSNGQRGDVSFEFKYKNGDRQILNSYQAMRQLVELAGIEKVKKCPLKLYGKTLISEREPVGKRIAWMSIDGGCWLNCLGSIMDRFKVMRALVSIYRLPVEVGLSKQASVKTPRGRRSSAKTSSAGRGKPKRAVPSEIVSSVERAPEGFVFGSDGLLNLFDD